MPARVRAASTPVCLWGRLIHSALRQNFSLPRENIGLKQQSVNQTIYFERLWNMLQTASETFDDVNSFPGVTRPATEHRLTRVMQDSVLILSFDSLLVFNDVYLKE